MLVQKLLFVAEAGATYVLYLLLGLSVLSVGVILDRWFWFRRRRIDATRLGRALVDKLRAGDLDGARDLMRATPGIEAEVLADALGWYEHGPDAVAEVLANGARERRTTYESGLLFLGTLGNSAPFIGLFGTVLAVVTAFRRLGEAAAGAMGGVMGSIAEALVATAVGIFVAVPAVVAYNVFQKKTVELEENVATLGGYVLAHMKSRRSDNGEGEA